MLAVWALTAILSAAILVGHLSEWLKYLPKPAKTAFAPPAVTRDA